MSVDHISYEFSDFEIIKYPLQNFKMQTFISYKGLIFYDIKGYKQKIYFDPKYWPPFDTIIYYFKKDLGFRKTIQILKDKIKLD